MKPWGFTALALTLWAGASHAAVFGLIDTGELYSSQNGGATWSAVAALTANDAVGLAAGTSSSDLYVATRSGTFYRSTNGGAAWSAIGAVLASDLAAFTIVYDGSLLALTESGTLYRSTNGGSTFSGYAALTGSNFVSLARGPLGRLYALAATGEVYESQNQGAAWTAVGRATVSNAVSLGRRNAELEMLTQTGEVYRSIDYGRTWVAIGAITASNMRGILDNGSGLLAAAETGEVYGSSNGAAWAAVGAIQQLRVRALGSDTPLVTGVPDGEAAPRFVLHAPFPNPTTRRIGSTFRFEAPEAGRVSLDLFDVQGRRVAGLGPVSFAESGSHRMLWRPEGLPAGAYEARLTTSAGHVGVTRWILVR